MQDKRTGKTTFNSQTSIPHFQLYGSYFLSVIPPVIVYPVHLQSLIPYFSEFQNDFGAKSFNIKQVLNKT